MTERRHLLHSSLLLLAIFFPAPSNLSPTYSLPLSAFLAQTWLSGPLIGRLIAQVEEVEEELEEEEEDPNPFSVAVSTLLPFDYSPLHT